MAKDELIDSHVSLKQCKLAVEALLTHALEREKKLQESELLPGKEPNVWLNVTVKKIPPGHKFKPIKVPIAHPLVDPRTTPVCLITKDPQREYKDLLEAQNVKFISRVVGIEKLKGKFKPFEARRMLLKENGLFLADERIVPLLPKLLGVKWFEAKKQPIPVCLKRKDLKGELERAISSTYMNQNKGTCTSIKIGILSQKPSQILANLKMALPSVAKNIYGGWENIQAFHIKTNSSASLPIWSCTLDESEGGRWNGLTAASDDEEDMSNEGSDDEEEIEVDVVETKQAASKGKKRAQDGDDDEPEKPKKKAKGAEGATLADPVVTISKLPGKASISPPKSVKPVSTVSDAPTKTKKRKSLGSEPLPAQPPPSVTRPSVGTSEIAKIQGRKSRPTADEAVPSTPEIPTPSVSDKKKKKRSQATDTPAPAPTSTDNTAIKKKARVSAAKDLSDEPTPDTTASSSKVIDENSQKKKKGQKAETAETPVVKAAVGGKDKKKVVETTPPEPSVTPSASLTKDEMKQKRSASVGEKKKIKTVKTMGGKSAKDRVLGKKAAQG